MSHPKPLWNDSLAAHPDIRPLKYGDKIRAVHLSGTEMTVVFEGVEGDKMDRCAVRCGMAGIYDVNMRTGQLVGGRPRKKASVWKIHPQDMARIRATARRNLHERELRMKEARYGSGYRRGNR